MGNIVESQNVTKGEAAIAPTPPSREGYRFNGWDTDFSHVTSNLTVKATWVIDPTNPTERKRLAGSNRYETMSTIVEAGFDSSEWVVVATGANFPDALVASSLAGLKECPVVLTKGTISSLGTPARQTIGQLGAKYAYVVGGTGVVSQGIEDELESMGISVTRIAGANRQATSIVALNEISGKGSPDTVVIATGWSFADALSIGPWCYKHTAPILLAKNGMLSDSQVEAVRSTPSITKVVIVGGTATVSDEVMRQLGNSYTYERLAGSNRYDTPAAIAEWELEEGSAGSVGGGSPTASGMGLEYVAVATGKDYPDALAGTALCGKNNSALLLVAPGEKNITPAEGVLLNHPKSVSVGYVLGGTSAVDETLVNRLKAATE